MLPEEDWIAIEAALPYQGRYRLVHDICAQSIEGILADAKLVTRHQTKMSDDWVCDHFGIMPGTLILEFVAQSCAYYAIILGYKGTPAHIGDDNVRYRKPVLPGDLLVCEVRIKDDDKFSQRFLTFDFIVRNQRNEKVSTGTIIGVPLPVATP